jgi:hypothetical protein
MNQVYKVRMTARHLRRLRFCNAFGVVSHEMGSRTPPQSPRSPEESRQVLRRGIDQSCPGQPENMEQEITEETEKITDSTGGGHAMALRSLRFLLWNISPSPARQRVKSLANQTLGIGRFRQAITVDWVSPSTFPLLPFPMNSSFLMQSTKAFGFYS